MTSKDFNLLSEAGLQVKNFSHNPETAGQLVVSASRMLGEMKADNRKFEEPALAISELLVSTGRVRPALEIARQIVSHLPVPNNGGNKLQRSATELLLQIGYMQAVEHPSVAVEAYGAALASAEKDSLPHHNAALGLLNIALSTTVPGLDNIIGRHLGASSVEGSPESDLAHDMRKVIGPNFRERYADKKELVLAHIQSAYEARVEPVREWGNAVRLFKSRIVAPC